jgi:hypothetical protein
MSLRYPTDLKAFDGSSSQFDAAFRMDQILVIVECKAAGTSLSFERGDPSAVNHRLSKVHEGVTDVDEKTNWPSTRPVGKNYDVSAFDKILPIVVTPFVEFIPTLETKYWISDRLPRVYYAH